MLWLWSITAIRFMPGTSTYRITLPTGVKKVTLSEETLRALQDRNDTDRAGESMRRQSPWKQQVRTVQDEIILNKLAEAAVVNAEHLLVDAESLQDRASFGHGFALAVLAEEELGKASVLWLAGLDKTSKFTLDGKVILGGRIYEPFGSHPMKQAVQLGPAFLESLFMPTLKDLLDQLKIGSLNPDAVMEAVDKHFAELTRDPDHWLETLKPLIELGGLEREKQSGLYVDYRKGNILEPGDFPGDRCKQLVQRVSSEIQVTREYMSKGLPEGLEDIFLKSYALFDRSDFLGLVKKWRAGKLSQPRLQKEIERIKKKLTAMLRESFREYESQARETGSK